MNLFSLTLAAGVIAPAQPPVQLPSLSGSPGVAATEQPGTPPTAEPPAVHPAYEGGAFPSSVVAPPARRRFESDHAFDGFVNPVSNPVLAKDPRANTWVRFLFINNNFPGSHPFGGGNAQVYAMQVNVALTERLAFIADKDGYIVSYPKNTPSFDGWANIAAGLKYTLIRNVERQFVLAVGLMYEIPTGSSNAFQGTGSGIYSPFVTYAKQFGEHTHFMATHGLSVPGDQNRNSTFFYHSWHLDREMWGWFYPLVEMNLFHYTAGGNQLPPVVGEGDGLLNLGTSGMDGKVLLTTAVGAKFKLSNHAYAGVAYEFPLTDYKGLLNNRITVDFVLRY